MLELQLTKANITDEYNGKYDNAVVAIWGGAGYSKLAFKAVEIKAGAKIQKETGVDSITYKVNYWYTESNMNSGVPSRPLKELVDGELTDILSVNLERQEVIAIINSNLSLEDKVDAAIKADLLARY